MVRRVSILESGIAKRKMSVCQWTFLDGYFGKLVVLWDVIHLRSEPFNDLRVKRKLQQTQNLFSNNRAGKVHGGHCGHCGQREVLP